ncbi:hypothetical protein [Pseudonocardia sp. DLS-67]
MHPFAHEMHIVQARRRELEAAAAAHRLARSCARRSRPSPVLRLYARLWWASRPRAAAWTPGLFGPHSA